MSRYGAALIRTRKKFAFLRLRYQTAVLGGVLIIVGLLLVIFGQGYILPSESGFSERVGRGVNDVGIAVLVLGGLHLIYELTIKRKFFEEIYEVIVSARSVVETGIVDASADSMEVDYGDDMKITNNLTLCLMYSDRLLKRYAGCIKERCESRKMTEIFFIDDKESSPLITYLKSIHRNHSDIVRGTDFIKRFPGELFREEQFGDGLTEEEREKRRNEAASQITLYRHSVETYQTIVKTDLAIYIILKTHGPDIGRLPAIKITCDSPLYNFLEKEVNSIKSNSHQCPVVLPYSERNDERPDA